MSTTTDLFKNKLKKFIHLKNIRDRLWTGDGKSRVSVMVGAGFSLNAKKLGDSFEGMSMWTDLKNKLVKALGINEESDYHDVLSLGQKYADEFGRTNLDELLKRAIPDQNYEPGGIHRSLLRLPWADIYTTNYDTLLERTLPQIYERSYQVIYDVSDIPGSVAPRIVKLHGSFPSNRPFIFTKTDYDSYEQKFAGFVNMVQQSIMETTLVLIGFSGDDPNFEKWIGWVNDNLGEHTPKIYMLAYNEQKNEHELLKKGVTLIDFKEVYADNNDDIYERMFKDVFEFLSYNERKDEKDWPYQSYLKRFSNIDEALEVFIKNRLSYPGWLIIPDIIKKRNIETIQLSTNDLIRLIQKEKDINKIVKLMSELIWANDIFQIPMDYYFYKKLKEIVDRGNQEENINHLSKILMRLIKEARLDFNINEVNYYSNLLNSMPLSEDIKNQFIYEHIILNLAKFEYGEVRRQIDEWEITNNNLEWNVKKANVLAKIGEKEKAFVLLENCLNNVRRLITVRRNDYGLLSLEGIILVNLIQIDNGNKNRHSYKNSKNRLSFLDSKLCNPLKELDFLYSRIRTYERKTGVFEKRGFDPGRITKTSRFQNTINPELVDSYCLLMITEEYGLKVGNTTPIRNVVKIAIKNMEQLYPFYSWLSFLKIGYKKEVDDFFTRGIIYNVEGSNLTNLFEIINNGFKNKLVVNISMLIEVVSRIYFALANEEKAVVDKIALEIFVDKNFYDNNRNLISSTLSPLFKRIIFDKSPNEKAKFLGQIIKLPIIGEPDGELMDIAIHDHDFFDPIFEFSMETDGDSQLQTDIDETDINRLLQLLYQERSGLRDAAMTRLVILSETKNLGERDLQRLREGLTHIIANEEYNFGAFLDSFLVLLTGNSEFKTKFLNKFINQDIPESYKKGAISSGAGLNILLSNLTNLFPAFIKQKRDHFESIDNESYVKWLKKFLNWWENQEEWLLRQEKDELFFENDDLLQMTLFLKNSFLSSMPYECLTTSDLKKFNDIYLKLSEHKRHIALLLIPVLLRINAISDDELSKTLNSLLDNDPDVSKAGIASFYDLVVFSTNNEIKVDLSELKSILINMYLTRKEVALLEVTKSLGSIIHFSPEFFNDNEFGLIIKTLKLLLNDLLNNSYQDSSISDQIFELLAESTRLAGIICSMGNPVFCAELKGWKELSVQNRLPEVRMHAYRFNS